MTKLSISTPGDDLLDGRQAHRHDATEHVRKFTDSHQTTKSLYARNHTGEIWFRLQRHQGGLYVEREERPLRGRPYVQSFHFRDAREFERWCADDAVRFEHPLLHVDVKREAADLWQLG